MIMIKKAKVCLLEIMNFVHQCQRVKLNKFNKLEIKMNKKNSINNKKLKRD